MKHETRNIKHEFADKIFEWYRKNKKRFDFPWRKTKNPYHILVSEIMLQQTQISRVLPKYEEWLKLFPTIESLAEAPFPAVLYAWHGLGYNRRARYIKNCAEIIAQKHNGLISHNPELLASLPGIGHYTSRAVACFAYGKCEPFLDTNIRRVFINFFSEKLTGKIDDKKILSLAARNAPKRIGREWYYALMDYGREVLGGSGNNPNRRSKQYKKQTPFQGSQRQVRASVVSHLLSAGGWVRTMDMARVLKKKGISASYLFPRTLSLILASLEKERLIVRRKNTWMIERK